MDPIRQAADKERLLKRHNVRLLGTGERPMVFSHGLGCDQTVWRLIAPAFESTHRLVLFDHVGSGHSDRKAYRRTKYQSLAGYADDLLELYEALDLQGSIFVGHSVSAMIGLLASLKAPQRFGCLIMLGPSPRYINDQDYVGGFSRDEVDELLRTMALNYDAWVRQMAPAAIPESTRPEAVEELANSFINTDPVIMRQFAETTFLSDTRAELPRCSVPALILQCPQDIVVPVAVGEYMHRNLAHSRYVLMHALGHYPHLSSPEETVQAIREFLSSELRTD